VLRSAQREMESLISNFDSTPELKYSHPVWLKAMLQEDWPDDYLTIMQNNHQQAPMTLRVNKNKNSLKQYQKLLEQSQLSANAGDLTESALILSAPTLVENLPGFSKGLVSVQDEASQLAVSLLNPQNNETILDACAAPGGKTCSLLESQPDNLELLALDNSNSRLEKVRENLARLQLQATILCGNAQDPASWWDRKPFDSILLDAPCTGTGVIRRHPDIKLLRHAEDVPRLASIQQQLLTALWPCLKKGGRMMYSTCSVLKAENTLQIEAFLASTKDAKIVDITLPGAIPCRAGIQFLPGQDNLDGFYYALLEKI